MRKIIATFIVVLKKAAVLGPFFVLIGLISVPLQAWKPNQHVALGWWIWNELLDNDSEGSVLINGVRYPVNPAAKAAILAFPIHYLMGCIGPDAYPDIYFGQCFVHPDTFWTGDDHPTISDQWLRQVLQFASNKSATDGGAALAFAYGFISHAAGDMWCHTFVNKYAGGVWPEILEDGLTIPVRHTVIESYMNKITGSIGTEAFRNASDNVYVYQHDPSIHQFIYLTFIDDEWARDNNSSLLFSFFYNLKSQLSAGKNKDWVEAIDMILPHDLEIGTYIENWIDDIDAGLKEWIYVSSKIAYSLFIWENAGQAIDFIKGWASGYLPDMLGVPDWIQDLKNALSDIGKDFNNILEDLLDGIPGLKAALDFFKDLKNEVTQKFENWIAELTFGITLDQLEDMMKSPEYWLNDPGWFGDAPFGLNTKSELDNEFAHSLDGNFDAFKFDASYNTIMASKLLLLDGPTLNLLLANHGYSGTPLYGPGELEDAQMCAMLGFMRSLDADHQWMKVSPDGEVWGGGQDGSGEMRMWENYEARELAFKKIFHMGLDMNIVSPEPLELMPGTPGTLEVEVINTENQSDTFGFSMRWSIVNPPFVVTLDDISVAPGTPQTHSISITVPRECSFAPGIYSYTLTGKSVGRTWLDYDLIPEKDERGAVRVLPFYEPDIMVSPDSQTTNPGGSGSYTVELTNKGNVPDAYGISFAYEDFDGAYYAYPTALQPGWVSIGVAAMKINHCETQTTDLSISIPGDWAGMEPTTYRADLTAQSYGDSNAQDSTVATIVVQPTKESKTRYLDFELLWLQQMVSQSTIDPIVKASLLDQLTQAITKKEQALAYLLTGRIRLANNMLAACREIVKAFIYLVEAQSGKAISPATAGVWVSKAQVLFGHISETILTQ